MPNIGDDLYLRILTELENKKAFEQVDDLTKYIQKNLGQVIDKTSLHFPKSGADGKSTIYTKLIKEGEAFLKVQLEVENATGKLLRMVEGSVSSVSKKDLLSFSGLSEEDLTPNIEEPTTKGKKRKKTNFWKSFAQRFKSYGILRILRNFFSAIERGLAQGIQQLSLFDKQSNQTMSQLTSSFDKIGGAVAIAVMPLLEAITPIVQEIAQGFASVAENISLASSMSKGLSTYTKINDEYMKSFSDGVQSALASFDKFESLNAQESVFEVGNVSEASDEEKEKAKETAKTIESIKNFILEVWDILKKVWDILEDDVFPILKKIWDVLKPLVEPILDMISAILELVDVLLDALEPALNIIVDLIGSIVSQISGAVKMTSGMIKMLTGDFKGGWSDIEEGFSTFGKGIGDFVVSAFTPVYINTDSSESASSILSGASVGGGGGGGFGARFTSDLSGVVKDSVVEAVYESSDVFQQQSGDVVLNLDGAEIARSKRFTSEVNRKNSGINLK